MSILKLLVFSCLLILSNQLISQTLTTYGNQSGTVGNISSFFGYQSGLNNLADSNTFVGAYSGLSNTNGRNNLFIGANAGKSNTTACNQLFIGNNAGFSMTDYGIYSSYSHMFDTMLVAGNVFIGIESGYMANSALANVALGHRSAFHLTDALYNVFIGNNAGYKTNTGSSNTFVGSFAGENNKLGRNNVFLGSSAGRYMTGNNNIALGQDAGRYNEGNYNIFIGSGAGQNLKTESHKLIIGTWRGPNNYNQPLLYGDLQSNQLSINTNKLTEGYALSVNGGIIATTVKVQQYNAWPDYVFEDDYNLLSISELGKFIATNGHLPNINSAEEVESNGFALEEMNAKLLEKIEELTLYLIEQNKRIDELTEQVDALQK